MTASDLLFEALDLGTVAVFPDVRGSTPFFSNGLLLLVRALFSGSELAPSVVSWTTAGEVALPARVAERSVLPKYSSLGALSVGEGEMTSGVLGMGLRRVDIMKKLQD